MLRPLSRRHFDLVDGITLWLDLRAHAFDVKATAHDRDMSLDMVYRRLRWLYDGFGVPRHHRYELDLAIRRFTAALAAAVLDVREEP